MAKLLINELTKKRLDGFIKKPSHSLMLIGQEGSGLKKIAEFVRKIFTSDSPDADSLVLIEPNEKGTITIESIRSLSKRLKLHSSSPDISIVTLIETAEIMPTEAQNALLKLLEEPPQGVLFILLAQDSSKILPTISSRCVNIEVLPVSLKQAQLYFDDNSEEFVKYYRLSGGQADLLEELVLNEEHPLVHSIKEAKSLLSSTIYERLKQIEKNYKKRDAAFMIIQALLRVCRAGLQSGKTSPRWIHNNRACLTAIEQLEANVQSKLVLDRLFLNVR